MPENYSDLTYKEAVDLAKKLTDILVKKRALKSFCTEKGISYHDVLVYIRGNKKIVRYPKIIKEILEAHGYEVKIQRRTIYDFFIKKNDGE